MESTTSNFGEFTLFPNLPYELRLKIWSFIAPGPRNVEIVYKTKYETIDGRGKVVFTGWTSPNPLPVILHICHESRIEALKTYQLALNTVFTEPQIYINFNLDTLCFGSVPDVAHGSPSAASGYLLDVLLGGSYHGAFDTEKIQRLRIDVPEDLYARKSCCWDEMRELPALKELTLVAWEKSELAATVTEHFRGTLTTVSRAHPEWSVPSVKVVSWSAGTLSDWGMIKIRNAEEEV